MTDEDEAELSGRTYAHYLSLNTGSFDAGLELQTIVRTREGFTYDVDLNGMRPFGFSLFANSSGYTDPVGNPLYRSLNLAGTNTSSTLPPGTSLHLPSLPDTATQYTHKLFFETPDPVLPRTASSARGTEWLNPNVPATPTVSNFEFVGAEGTPFKAGTNPLTGTFQFDTDYVGNFAVIVDLDGDGVYGTGPDKTIGGVSTGGASTAVWDGTDIYGDPVPAGDTDFNAQVQVYLGEAHFPFFDVEHVPNGLEITRTAPTVPVATQADIFWDDRLLTDNTEPTCVTTSPAIPTNPVVSLTGQDSLGGARGYDNNYGNCKAIDTWSRVEYPLDITSTLELRESDLTAEYIAPSTYTPGSALTYAVRYTNLGPTDKLAATITGTLPPQFRDIVSSCNACSQYETTPTTYTATADIPAGERLNLEFTATVSADTTGPITQDTRITRSADFLDPALENNQAQLVLTYEAPTTPPAPILIRTGGRLR